jgi:RNA polymerase sigma factor (sigma-70 family)
MESDAATASIEDGTDALLQSLVRGQRGEALRAQLALRYPETSPDAIEEAIQYACKSFLEEAGGITAPGQIYTWIRTAAFRSLGREADRHHREIAVDPAENGLDRISTDEASPAAELIELEDDADLELLVREVSSSLSERRRDVLALYGAGCKRPEIADRLGLPKRVVKRDIEAIMERRGRPSPASRAAAAIEASRWSCASSAASRPPRSQRRLASIFLIAGAASCSARGWPPGETKRVPCFPRPPKAPVRAW